MNSIVLASFEYENLCLLVVAYGLPMFTPLVLRYSYLMWLKQYLFLEVKRLSKLKSKQWGLSDWQKDWDSGVHVMLGQNK